MQDIYRYFGLDADGKEVEITREQYEFEYREWCAGRGELKGIVFTEEYGTNPEDFRKCKKRVQGEQ